VGLIIPPTLLIDHQMQQLMTTWGTTFLHLDKVKAEDLAATIQREKPAILLSSIERLKDKTVLTALFTIRLDYISVDEAQVS
jgi:hypothetical protein